jgi:hypothetical protein
VLKALQSQTKPPPFTETRQPGRAAGPMPLKPFIDGRYSCFDVPRRPWPSLRRCCPRASKGDHYIGTYGRPPMSSLRRTLLNRGPGVCSSWSRSGASLVSRFAQARRRTRAAVQKPFQRRGEVFLPRISAVFVHRLPRVAPVVGGPVSTGLLQQPLAGLSFATSTKS